MPIRQLADTMINQIAAGEVVERPASVVKELVENALDAGAGAIEVATAGGGLGLIRVLDDGDGIPADEMVLAVSRHCTSKLDHDINAIHTLGFRGEALPSIGSVARLSIRSRVANADSGAEIRVEGGSVSPMKPVGANRGTMVEVRDLFFATPARLKFMKGARAESAAVTDVVKRMAIAFPQVRFTVSGTDRSTLDLPAVDGEDALSRRISQILGTEFVDNALAIDAEREGVRLTGLISIPSYSRATAQQQYAFVNGRPVRDKLIAGAIRGAFADVLPRDRHAVTALFVWLDPADVDVNVHPAKSDVRFRDAGKVRGLIIGAVRETLAASGIRASTSAADAMIDAFRPMAAGHHALRPNARNFHQPLNDGFGETGQALFENAPITSARSGDTDPVTTLTDAPLGAARAQIHENYIVAQTRDLLVIVDQHAAHERLIYEALKNGLEKRPAAAQMLLLPEIVDLPEEDADRLAAHAPFLAKLGLGIERFGPGAVAVRETPAMLGETDTQALIRDLADEIADNDTTETLRERLNKVAATMACHGSVRSGRRMRPEEMNALLREMEATPGSGTCNHGRPTYIELKLTDIERLFGRR